MPRRRQEPSSGSSNGEPPAFGAGRPADAGLVAAGLVEKALRVHGEQPVAVVDDQRRLLFFNQAADDITKRVTGRGLELDQPIEQYLLEENRPHFTDAIDRALEGEASDLTFEVPELDELAEWREYRFRPVQTDSARAVYVSAIDVAAERRADERFWTIFGTAPIPMLILDEDGCVREVNDALSEQLGYPHDAIASEPVWRLAPEEVREEVADEYRRFIAGEIGTSTAPPFESSRWYSRERRYLDADDQICWADVARVAVRRPDGTLDYILVMLLDITEYKLTLLDLEKERARTQAVFDAAVDGIITVDKNGLIRQFNRAAEEIFGYRANEVIGKSATMLVSPSRRNGHGERLDREEMRRLAHIVGSGGEFEAMRKDGTIFPVYLSVGKMRVDKEHKYAGIVRDLTHQKELEQRVRRAERMEALGQLAGGIAHDFNNVLTIVNSYAHACKTALEEAEDPLPYVDKIRAAADRGARLTRQLLTFSPEQIGEPETLDLNEVVCDLEALVSSVIEEDIELSVLTEADVPAIVADPGQIEQVLMNLVVNARDAMRQGGELAIATKRVVLGRQHPAVKAAPSLTPGDYALLQVSDTGHGMDKGTLARVFDPLFTTKPEGKGTGLGLSTVYGIVKRYHGAILVDSTHGEGSVFSVYFPAAAAEAKVPTEPVVALDDEQEALDDEQEALDDEHEALDDEHEARPEEDEAQAEPAAEVTGTILVVEDESDIREPLCMVLESEGFTVLQAASGDEALEIVGEFPEKIDLVLTDVVMPGLTGVDLANSLREQYPSIQSVLVSGYSGEVLERKDIDVQQVRVSKPYDLDELLAMVRELLSP